MNEAASRTPQLDLIAAVGTRWPPDKRGTAPSNHVECVDGFRLSVVAGRAMYCSPRPGWPGATSEDYAGPYTHVEVGFPSAKPEPWSEWELYCENVDDPTETVYAYVPVSLVRALIESHGGENA